MEDQLQYLISRLEKIDAKYDMKLDKILEQTTKTNGRVNAIEAEQKEVKERVYDVYTAHKFNKGRDKVLYVIGVVIATVFGFIIQHWISK